ncbi:zincin-like metallopeptidase domain-containing protein [Acidithiobacillus thiooxidans]|uniref:DNA primase TraC n=3 Tax=Acidithiobacillus thiooxidans TaxID=930 RepID=A0A5P9XTJ1_ACITH|nr:zincin-like metallopeptidase domain-containing protein [Acidithiobacillus thiooxidans]QFX96683.1 hypothetical protein GCD22_02493 [Acidithiobacillus thiooxidans ATCC 19377]
MAKKQDMRLELADRLIEMMEKGTAHWQRPWVAGEVLAPVNAVTGKPYRGVNYENLMFFSPDPSDPRWCTYNQARDQGWQVREGASGLPLEVWKNYEHQRTEEEIQRLRDEGVESPELTERRMGVRYYTVFHASQIDGIPPLDRPLTGQEMEGKPDDRLPRLAETMGVELRYGGGRAFYRPSEDRVQMPPVETFERAAGHDSTLLHELSHATGHSSRMGRDLRNAFGSEKYAIEELRAEMSAAMTAATLGVGFDPDAQNLEEGREMGNSAAYLASWLRALPEKDRKKIVVDVIRDAQNMSEYLLERTPEVDRNQLSIGSTDVALPEFDRVQGEGFVLARNAEREGLEVQFEEKPDQEMLDALKSGGFRWSRGQGLWYARDSERSRQAAAQLLPESEREKILPRSPEQEQHAKDRESAEVNIIERPRVGDLVRFEPHEPGVNSMPFSGRVIDALDTNTGDIRYHLRAETGPDQSMEARVYGRDGQFREIAMEQAVGFDRALAPEPEKTQGFHVGDFVTTHENHFGADWNTHSILVGLDDQQVKLQNLYRSGQEWKVSPGIQTMSPERFKQTVRHQVSGVVPPEIASAENGGHSIARRDRIEKAVNAFHAENNLHYGKTPPTPERVPEKVRYFLGDRQALATDQLLRDKEGKAFYGDKMQELNNIIMDMPQTYETDGKSDAEKVAALRYFGPGNAQFFIIEKDRGDPENEGSGFPRQKQAFGLADLGEGAPEMGYINIEEITRAGAQLDYHFTPQNLLEIKQEKYPELMSLKDRAEISPAFVAKHLAPPHESLSVFASASGQDLLGRVVLSDYGPDAKGNMGIQSDTTYVRFSPEINEKGESVFVARDRANPAGKAHYFEAVLRNVEKDDGTHFLSLNYFEKHDGEERMRLLTALSLKPNEAMKEVGFDDPAAKMVKNYLGLDMGAEANKDIAPDTGLKTGKETALESVRDFYEYLPDRVHDLMDTIKDRHEELSPADFEGHRQVRADFQAGVDDVLGIIREGPDRGANKNWLTLEKAGFTPDEISKMPLMDDVQNATRRHGQNLSAFSKELDNQFTENLKAHGKERLKNPENLSKLEMGQAVFWKHGIQVEGTDNLMLNRFIDAVDNKDLPKLLSSIGHNSQNPASQEIFERLTGETLGKTQKARVETLEKWAGSEVVQTMKTEQAEKAAARAIEKPIKNLQNRYDDLKNLRVRTLNGQGQEMVLNGHEYLSHSADMGFTDTFSRKKGAVLEYGLLNKEEGIYRTVKDTRLTQFIKAARDVDSEGQWLPALEKAGIALGPEKEMIGKPVEVSADKGNALLVKTLERAQGKHAGQEKMASVPRLVASIGSADDRVFVTVGKEGRGFMAVHEGDRKDIVPVALRLCNDDRKPSLQGVAEYDGRKFGVSLYADGLSKDRVTVMVSEQTAEGLKILGHALLEPNREAREKGLPSQDVEYLKKTLGVSLQADRQKAAVGLE